MNTSHIHPCLSLLSSSTFGEDAADYLKVVEGHEESRRRSSTHKEHENKVKDDTRGILLLSMSFFSSLGCHSFLPFA
jgi:hypothetical protein